MQIKTGHEIQNPLHPHLLMTYGSIALSPTKGSVSCPPRMVQMDSLQKKTCGIGIRASLMASVGELYTFFSNWVYCQVPMGMRLVMFV